MQMDGRLVGQALGKRLRPELRALGFNKFQGRHAWRRTSLGVAVVSFSSMNSYTAQGVGCTSFSFGGEVAVCYPQMEDHDPVEWPRPWHALLRASLGKTLRQPIFHPWGQPMAVVEDWRRDRPDVWYVLEDGSNLDQVTKDALSVAVNQGIPFIDLVADPARAATYLTAEQNRDTEFGQLGTVAMGRLGSPQRLRSIERLLSLADSAGA
ncbi:MAG: hypothetical protein KKH51_07310 [Actinobacteria bacterium]|nr:hypothetical protein [Actinomycetota bacterium]